MFSHIPRLEWQTWIFLLVIAAALFVGLLDTPS